MYHQPAADDSQSEHEGCALKRRKEEERVATEGEEVKGELDEVSEEEEPQSNAPEDIAEECHSEDEVAGAHSTNSDHSDSEADQGAY